MTGSSAPARLALAVFRLSPAGGLEQHALRLAAILAARGATVTMITTRAPDTPPTDVAVEVIAARGRTNHGRLAAFAADAARAAAGRFERTVAFHAVPGFDVIVCADPARGRPRGLKGVLPRYRVYASLEGRALASARRFLCLSSAQLQAFAARRPDARDRLVLLPPTIDRRRANLDARRPQTRLAARRRLGLDADAQVWLWLGLQPRTKGLDRALLALAAMPAARLLVCGLPAQSRAAAGIRRLARRLRVADRLTWLGFVEEDALASAMAAADLLVHPSRADVTGTVILEAMANGLPVITTAVCGYGEHVAAADGGVVLAEPFAQAALAGALATITPRALAAWSAHALAYATRDELYTGLERAADIILEAPRGL
jgi:UDP-glucose:(heptosyl)LPS alpha-1,3-glucosyltransferase